MERLLQRSAPHLLSLLSAPLKRNQVAWPRWRGRERALLFWPKASREEERREEEKGREGEGREGKERGGEGREAPYLGDRNVI